MVNIGAKFGISVGDENESDSSDADRVCVWEYRTGKIELNVGDGQTVNTVSVCT